MIFNIAKNKFLQNSNIRRAISLAISRKSLTKVLGPTSKVAQTITPAGLTKVNGKDYITTISASAKNYNLSSANQQLAQKYLDKGLKQLGVNKASFKLTASDSDLNKQVTEALQSQLEMNLKNVSVEVQNLPAKALMGRIASADYDILSVATGGDYNDPASILDGLVTKGSFNYGGWSNRYYDRLITQASNEGTAAKRYKLLAQAEGVALKDEVWSPLFYMVDPWLIRSNVHGIVYTSDIWDLKTAYITK
ncbi:ABC transporter substrate-binding protein [Liquorilactobacillus vini]|uniref:ABC transporter substrate-binding protein n=1 Tax=Liquorilactobacillus vini TaxID=238015 RepID=UPI00191C2AB7